jgi:hypothetical protein
MKPTIELKNINISVKLSEETPAYTAKLFVDGKFLGEVRNQGFGGCDIFDGKWDDYNDVDKRVRETYPKRTYEWGGGGEFDETLECICHGLVWLHVDQRNMKSRLSKTVMTFEDGKVYTFKGKRTKELEDRIATQKPNATILNRLSFEKAWAIIQEHAA